MIHGLVGAAKSGRLGPGKFGGRYALIAARKRTSESYQWWAAPSIVAHLRRVPSDNADADERLAQLGIYAGRR
jgi:hypothetical protein